MPITCLPPHPNAPTDIRRPQVKLGAECVRDPTSGVWSVDYVDGRPRYVAIKQLSKTCIRKGITVDGRRVAENPLQVRLCTA